MYDKDHLHGMKIIRMAPSTYSDDMVKEKSVAWNADARAGKVHSQYIRKAHNLNVECFSSEPDVQARPILRKQSSYLRIRGHCVGAFAVCSLDIHLLLRETVRSAVMRNWRQVGATSVGAAFKTYSARNRRHWGAELALPGARLRVSRAHLAFESSSCRADKTCETSFVSFDLSESAQYAAKAVPILIL